MLLHKVDVFRTVQLLALFDKIASIQLFKPAKTHATRSSFYLIAKNVQPRNAEALAAVEGWKEAWRVATFPCFLDEDFQDVQAVDSTEVEDLLKIFGERVVELGNPIWQIQKDALGKAQWFRGEGKGAGLEEKDR